MNFQIESTKSIRERGSVAFLALLFHPSSSVPVRASERKTWSERDPTQPKHFCAESFAQGEVENEKVQREGDYLTGWSWG